MGTFRSLRNFNYRIWASGAIVSNVGTWMQRTAQDWLVLTELTHHNATAVGIVMSLQFGPQMLLLPLTGYAADHFDRRKLLFATSFNAARMIGPAVAGLLIASVGTGWVFLFNALSFVAVLGSLRMLRMSELHLKPRAVRSRGSFVEGFKYVWKRPDLKAALLMLLLIGTFGLNFPIFITSSRIDSTIITTIT